MLALLAATGLLLVGIWTSQPVFFFTAGSMVLIGVAEVMGVYNPSVARAAKWVGRFGVTITALYIVFLLLFGT